MPLTFALQALLARHESCMAEAEEERQRMVASMGKLETDKKELEAANARTIKENRLLLDQLENVNSLVVDSDGQIQLLTSTLESTRNELQRLTVLAGRTTQLETQLLAMESEHANSQTQLAFSEEENRSTVQRWKRAQATIEQLQQQVDMVEKEAWEDHERHLEVVGQLERRRAVEKELGSAASRLKGAAAVAMFGGNKGGSNVVSHFVKDILQDNTNLQIGIIELREMLASSNEEVENLRERMMLHQPTALDDEVDHKATLKSQLQSVSSPKPVQEMHVHHHYHAPIKTESTSEDKLSLQKRSKKKRFVVTSGMFPAPSSSQTPHTPTTTRGSRRSFPSSATTTAPQMSVDIPLEPHDQSHDQSHRWSMKSSQTRASFAPSTVISSPQSPYQESSIFDCVNDSLDSSRPTSAESSGAALPMFLSNHRLQESNSPSRVVPTPFAFKSKPSELKGISEDLAINISVSQSKGQNRLAGYHASLASEGIVSEHPEAEITRGFAHTAFDSESYSDLTSSPEELAPSQLRRSISHESMLSISGMDIHAVRGRPSQMFTGQGFMTRTSYSTSSASITSASGKPVVSPTIATGRPITHRRGYDSSYYNRSLLSGVDASGSRGAQVLNSAAEKSTLGKRVGGWVWSKWGISPAASTSSLRAKAALSAIDERASGINQLGSSRGLRPPLRTSDVEPTVVNKTLLQESLEE
ncbi:hypothetical protein MMC06_004125 [Schaereria dolodes]|nr:hypothetical protein [Schaereria dolodes]